MKKLLLLLSFLVSQLFAEQCTEEQYKPEFDKKNDRYIFSNSSVYGNSVFDKKSIVYDKVNQKIVCWVIYQDFESPKYGKYKVFWEYNLKNNQVRVIEANGYKCNGKLINEESKGDWYNIVPNSANELVLNNLKKYLNIQ